jgi:hypothetical protein
MIYTYNNSEKTRERLGISRHRMRELAQKTDLIFGIHYVMVGKRRHYCWELIWDWFINSEEFGVDDKEAHGRAIDNFMQALPSQQRNHSSLKPSSKSANRSGGKVVRIVPA